MTMLPTGGLLINGDQDIQGLLAQFQPSPEDRKRAETQALLTLGLGLLGTPKGQEFASIGRGGLLALGAYNNALDNSQKAAIERMQAVQGALGVKEKMQQFSDQDAQRKALQAMSLGQLNMPISTNGASTIQASSSGTPSLYDRYNAMADSLEQQARAQGSPAVLQLAMKYREAAAKYAPKYKGMETVMQDGKPVLLQTFDNQPPSPMSGYAPKPDYKSVDTGAQVGFVDPLTGTQGPTFKKTVTPGEQLSADMQGRGQDITVRGQNMVDARARELNALTREQGQWVVDEKAGVRVNKTTGETLPLTAGGQPVGTEDQRKRATGASQSLRILNQAEPIIKDATGSLAGAAADTVAGAFGYSTNGAKAIAQLKALEGALMLNQPRMEGPQSDRDTALYRQMAGQIGDPTVPRAQKLAALETIKRLHQQYSVTSPIAGGPGQELADPLGIRGK